METTRPAWATIDLGAIRSNATTLRRHAGPESGLCAVVKADAYGHGAVETARAAIAGGASRLAVAVLSEALALREAGIASPILILGAVGAEEAEATLEAGLEASVFDAEVVGAFERAALKQGKRAKLHLKIDTGMSRVGCWPEEAPDLAALIASGRATELSGVYTHFADADSRDLGFAREQLRRFDGALAGIEARGIPRPLRHAANSAATLWLPESRLDMVRAGIALYGLTPAEGRDFDPAFVPALSIRARVTRIREVDAGTTVSYGRIWTAKRRSRIATIPIGYADGYPRVVSGKSWAGFGDRRLPQIGRVCMDMCMFDATDAPELREGSELVLAGPGGPSLEELARLAGTINYEIACHAALRLPHRHVDGANPR